MDYEKVLLEFFKVLSNAIMILGPASIAGAVGYFTARSQYSQRLKEMEKGHEFEARAHLFQYYKEKKEADRKQCKRLADALAGTLVEISQIPDRDGKITSTILERIEISSKTTLSMLRQTAYDMKEKGLTDNEHYRGLERACSMIEERAQIKSIAEWQEFVWKTTQVVGHNLSCREFMLDKRFGDVFEKYLD